MSANHAYKIVVHKQEDGGDVYVVAAAHGLCALEALETAVESGIVNKSHHGMYARVSKYAQNSLVFTFPIYFEEL